MLKEIKKEFVQEVKNRGYEDEGYYEDEFDKYISEIEVALKRMKHKTAIDRMYIIMNTIDYFMEERKEINEIKKALQILADEHLLNWVGEKILAVWNDISSTKSNLEEYFTGKTEKQILEELATSSLVGADDELAIEEWVDESETQYIWLEVRKRNVSIGKAGGNASVNAKTYKISIPSNWMTEMGITEENREVRLSFDGEKIIIEKDQ